MSSEKNARIQSTMLGIEDHGIMTFYLTLDYGGAGQSVGGWCLDKPVFDKNGEVSGRAGLAVGISFIVEVLKVVGVNKWEDLRNSYVRVRVVSGRVEAIGNFLQDEWLVFSSFFKHSS